MTHSAMSLRDWFVWAARVGQGEVGWYTQRVKTACQCLGWLWKSLS